MTDKPSYKQSHFSNYSEEYELVDDVWEQLARFEDLRRYLPARLNESGSSYLLRQQTTALPSSFRDGIEKAAGRLGKAQVSEDALEPIEALVSGVDEQKTTLDFFVFRVFVEIMKKQCCVVIVDTTGEQEPATLQLIPVTSIQNVYVDKQTGRVLSLTIAEEDYRPDGRYGVSKVKRYREYTESELIIWEDVKGQLMQSSEPMELTDANQRSRGEVFAVWFGTIGSTPWMPAAPPLLQYAKLSVHQMHKVSDLDRAETIAALPPILRYLPEGAPDAGELDDVLWDPGSVENVPFGGDLRPAQTSSQDFAAMHQRNQDRQERLDTFADNYLKEKARTDLQATMADDAETSRLELYVKSLQDGFSKVFRFVMRLSDRTYNPNVSPGELILSATKYDQVTDNEIKLLGDTLFRGAIDQRTAFEIARQQWKSRGYDIPEQSSAASLPDPTMIIE
ncbi:MAG: DUF4055 domain-containing protein [Cyanobacteria bacterium P01_F01_bin.13]